MARPQSRLGSRATRARLAHTVSSQIGPAERRYVTSLRSVMRAVARETMKAIRPHLDEVARADGGAHFDANTLANALNVVGVHIQVAIGPTVGPLFDRMSETVKFQNAKGQALMGVTPKNTGLGDVIAKARAENIALVEKAAREYASSVQDIIGDPDNFGLRVEELADKLRERGDVSESRAELIARDQTLKLNGKITETRQRAAGVESYVWSTSLDDRVREEHAALEGQTFSWDDAPEPGHPGEDIQCRCVAIPVVEELDEIFNGDDANAQE